MAGVSESDFKRYLLESTILTPEEKKRVEESFGSEGANRLTFEGIRRELLNALQAGTPEEVRERVDKILVSILAAGSILSFANPGSDFLDFAMGQSLHQIVSPIINAVIGGPLQDALQKGFRFSGPGMRALLPMMEAGIIDDRLLRSALIDAGLKDEYVEVYIQFAHFKLRDKQRILEEKARLTADQVTLYPIEQQQKVLERLQGRVEASLEALEERALTGSLDNDVQRFNALASRLDRTADMIEESTDEKVLAKTLTLAITLVRRSRALK